MKYEVIVDQAILSFQNAVESKLNEGWKLHGNLTTESFSVLASGKPQVTVIFMQAVTK
jgi:hypothetical protein